MMLLNTNKHILSSSKIGSDRLAGGLLRCKADPVSVHCRRVSQLFLTTGLSSIQGWTCPHLLESVHH